MDVNENGDNGGGNNPAWNDFLGVIPEEYHEAVTPHLKQWDSGVQQKIQSVHEQYQPYKQFVENKINPQELQMGYGLIRAINNDPNEVINAIRQTFNLVDESQGAKDNEDDPYADLPPAVKEKLALVDKLQANQENLGKTIQQQQQAALERQEGEKLAVKMSELREKYGNFDEEIILNLMLGGYEAEAAVQRYHQLADNIRSQHNRPSVPTFLGPGGSNAVPGQKSIDPRKLDSKGTRNLVAQMLEEAARANNQ